VINERKIEMRGSVRIYVNKKDREIYLLKEYKTKIGYWKCMGYLIQTDRESLKKEVLIYIYETVSPLINKKSNQQNRLNPLHTKHGISFLNIMTPYLASIT
jgi:hypothetical protein